MAGPVQRLCFLRDSEKVRAAIEHQLKRKKMSMARVAELAGVPVGRFYKWRNTRSPSRLNQYQLLSIAKVLGIEIDLTIKFVD